MATLKRNATNICSKVLDLLSDLLFAHLSAATASLSCLKQLSKDHLLQLMQ